MNFDFCPTEKPITNSLMLNKKNWLNDCLLSVEQSIWIERWGEGGVSREPDKGGGWKRDSEGERFGESIGNSLIVMRV